MNSLRFILPAIACCFCLSPGLRAEPGPKKPASSAMEGSRAGEVREFGGIEMVWCPPGEFLMGSPESEKYKMMGNNERQHRITLTRGFWLARTETTQGQWESVMGDNPSHFKGADLPVEKVSWTDCQEWLSKMNKKHPLPKGWKWELPTNAQWEYACRAGTETAFSFGNALNGKEANCDGSYPYPRTNAEGPNLGKTAKVGSYAANAWSLHDMHGNVAEMCRDWDTQSWWLEGSLSDGAIDPVGPVSGSFRVYRGGSWRSGARESRSASRRGASPDLRNDDLGFRPALVPTTSDRSKGKWLKGGRKWFKK